MSFSKYIYLSVTILLSAALLEGGVVNKSEASEVDEIPAIEQDVYIKEAIKQIEINKTNSNFNNQKDFIAEYTYRASDTDSKVSSRKRATQELKRTLLEEIGTHITSSLKITKQSNVDKRVRSKISYVITSYTAGSVKMKIIKEKWDGETFYLKGKITIDPNSVSEGIAEGLKAEAEKESILELQSRISEQQNALDMRSNLLKEKQNELSKTLITAKAQEAENRKLQAKLKEAKARLAMYKTEGKEIASKFNEIMARVNEQGNNSASYAKAGMRFEEVVTLLGEPDAFYSGNAIYGQTVVQTSSHRLELHRENAIVKCVFKNVSEWNSCKHINKYESHLLYSYK